jgi:hypothetical protein
MQLSRERIYFLHLDSRSMKSSITLNLMHFSASLAPEAQALSSATFSLVPMVQQFQHALLVTRSDEMGGKAVLKIIYNLSCHLQHLSLG